MATTWTDTRPVPANYAPRLLAFVSARLAAGDTPATRGTYDFPIFDDDPLAAAHRRIDRFVADARGKYDILNRRAFKVSAVDAAAEMLAADAAGRLDHVRAAVARELWFWKSRVRRAPDGGWTYTHDGRLMPLKPLIGALVRGVDAVPDAVLLDLLDAWALPQIGSFVSDYVGAARLIDWTERATSSDLYPTLRGLLEGVYAEIRDHDYMYASMKQSRALLDRIESLLEGPDAEKDSPPLIESGEAWSDAAAATLERASDAHAAAWRTLLELTQTADGSKPTKKWLKAAADAVKGVGTEAFVDAVTSWFDRAPLPRTLPLLVQDFRGGGFHAVPHQVWNGPNEVVLKGLAWACGTVDAPQLARPLGVLYAAAYKKLPEIGPRSPKVGNAAIWALTHLPGDAAPAEVVRLRSVVKQPTGRKMLDRAIADMAKARGIEPADLEELAVDDFGLVDGVRTITAGDATARLVVTAAGVDVTWSGPDGKARRSVPAATKAAHGEAVKQVAAAKKLIEAALHAQRIRLERALLRRTPWRFASWRSRYVEHPLVGLLARQLIWSIGGVPLLYRDGRFEDAAGTPVATPAEDADVRLWHPIAATADVVAAWRERLTALAVTQPFKQTYRESYPLTDAERATAVYSNRFAGHVIRQHQFKALADDRGWKYALMGGFDFHNTPAVEWPAWDVRAEFWVDVAAGSAVAASGIAMHLTTDQVRFTRPGSDAALPLEQVPPLAFSEIMRHVDLFVGVASVGNDPTWQDGGPDGRYRDYWRDYSFGELTESAKTRHTVLSSLLPRLTKLKGKWTLEDKFLVVRGTRRTYKIHLGSGNILMEPNDQYLCIVPDRSTPKDGAVFLPFEGDSMLSVILSKAFLLAEDAKITDPTITRQIGGGQA